MTCQGQQQPCISPRCRGADWVATSTDLKGFDAAVLAFMQKTGRRDVGKCAAEVFAAAQREPCIFS